METGVASAMPEDSAPNAALRVSLSPLRSEEKVQSRYLKPSMASCHDYCKHGKKHDSEAVSPDLRTFLKNKRVQIKAETQNGEERKLKMSIKLKSESEFSDKPDIPKPKSPALTKKKIDPREKKTLPISQDNRQSQVKSTTATKRRTWLQPQASPDKLYVTNLNNPSLVYEADVSVHNGSIEENTESTAILPASEVDLSVDTGSIKEDIESTVSGSTEISLINLLSASEEDFSVDPGSAKGNIESTVSGTTAINLINLSPASEADLSVDPGSVKENIESTISITTAINSVYSLVSKTDAKENTDLSVAPTKIKRKKAPISVVKKLQSTDRKAPLPLRKVDVIARSAIVLKTKTPLLRSISHLKSSRISIARTNQEKKATKSLVALKTGAVASKPVNTSKTTKAPLLRSISNATKSLVKLKFGSVATKPVNTSNTSRAPLLRSISSRRNQDKVSRSTGSSKIVSVDDLKTKNVRGNQERLHKSSMAERKVSKPPPSDSASILTPGKLRIAKRSTSLKRKDKTDEAANAKFLDSESANSEGISKGGYKRGARRALPQENNAPAPYKLKFRQGKVLDLRCDSIGARRLWFRVGRMAGENPSGNTVPWKWSFRKKDAGASDSDVPASDAPIVVLKHQDAEEKRKKDGQALFNEVIEETASKLVEARKSKVKALVGAFETVISLQETRPTGPSNDFTGPCSLNLNFSLKVFNQRWRTGNGDDEKSRRMEKTRSTEVFNNTFEYYYINI